MPASIVATVITPASSGSTLRDTIDCSASSRCAEATIGSRVRCGRAAWPERPLTGNSIRAPAAITAPSCTATVPASRPGQLW